MKKLLTLLIALSLLFVTVSCNMDSDTGLFQDAGTSVKKASYTIHNVLYRFSDTSFLVASDEGVFVFKNGSQSGSSYGTGINAENVIYAEGSEDNWYCIYFDESAGKYYKIGNNTTKTEYTELSGKYKNQGMYTYEYVDANKQAAVFKNSDDSKYYVYYSETNSAPTDSSLTSLTAYSYSGVTYMGDGYFIGEESGISYYFKSTAVSTRTLNEYSYITHLNGIFLDKSNNFNGTSSIGSAGGSTYRRVATSLTGGNRYFMLSGLNYAYYVNSSNSLVASSVSGLSSIEVLFVAKVVDGKYINVITAQNGAQCINLETKSIDSTWK